MANNDIKEVGGNRNLLPFILLNAASRQVLKDANLNLSDRRTINFPVEGLLDMTSKLPVISSVTQGKQENRQHLVGLSSQHYFARNPGEILGKDPAAVFGK